MEKWSLEFQITTEVISNHSKSQENAQEASNLLHPGQGGNSS